MRARILPLLPLLKMAMVTEATAQSLSPMRDELATYADTAGLRLTVGNPSATEMTVVMSAYEADWQPLEGARASRDAVRLQAGQTTPLFVTVPLDQQQSRDVRICATSLPQPSSGTGGTAIRGQVCGRYGVRRVR